MEASEKQCPFCAETIKAQAIRCKHCQADLSQAPTSTSGSNEKTKGMGGFAKAILILAFIVFALLSFGAYKANTPEGKEKSRARAAIEVCRDRESGYRGPESARNLLSGACAKLEDDFRAKFGVSP